MNGMNGCRDGCHEGCAGEESEDTNQHKPNESDKDIRLVCDAIESNGLNKSKQINGLIVNNNEDNKSNQLSDNCFGDTKRQLNSNSSCNCSYQMSTTSSTNNCCCCRTSSPLWSSSGTTSCCSSCSATLSCDMNNKELVVHSLDDNNKDINCLTNRVFNELNINEIVFVNYESERQMPDIMRLIQKDLSEPYSIYTYRYFIHNWPHLCFLVCLSH